MNDPNTGNSDVFIIHSLRCHHPGISPALQYPQIPASADLVERRLCSYLYKVFDRLWRDGTSMRTPSLPSLRQMLVKAANAPDRSSQFQTETTTDCYLYCLQRQYLIAFDHLFRLQWWGDPLRATKPLISLNLYCSLWIWSTKKKKLYTSKTFTWYSYCIYFFWLQTFCLQLLSHFLSYSNRKWISLQSKQIPFPKVPNTFHFIVTSILPALKSTKYKYHPNLIITSFNSTLP